MKKKSALAALEAWIAAGDRYHLADVHIQMARELGLDPATIGELAEDAKSPGKAPLHTFLAILYARRFGTKRPPAVRPLRETLAAARAKAERRRAERAEKFPPPPEDIV